jgi:hypothetical protein
MSVYDIAPEVRANAILADLDRLAERLRLRNAAKVETRMLRGCNTSGHIVTMTVTLRCLPHTATAIRARLDRYAERTRGNVYATKGSGAPAGQHAVHVIALAYTVMKFSSKLSRSSPIAQPTA